MKIYDYRNLRINNITQPEYKHILLLLYWPFYGLAFLTLERFLNLNYHTVECSLDRRIPFCEFFVIPYYFWFLFIAWMIVYTFFYDIPAFKKFSWFIIITYTVTCVFYIIYPTKQMLRPDTFERNNIFTQIVGMLYSFDTNTNVCPSLHVIGSMAVTFTAWSSKRYGTRGWRAAFVIMCILINLSTVFLKQHSVIDAILGLAVSFITYPFIFAKKKQKKSEQEKSEEKQTVTQ